MRIRFVKAFIKNNLGFYISLILTSAICFSVLVTFNYLKVSMRDGLDLYLNDYNYYDGLVQPYYGSFTEDEIDQINSIDGIKEVKEAYIVDKKINNSDYRYIRLIGTDLSQYKFYVVDEIDDGDIYLSAEFASVNNINVGDLINIDINNNEISLKVKKIINTPEILGAMRGVSYSLEKSSLGFAYIDIDRLLSYFDTNECNTIAYYLKDSSNSEEVVQEIKNLFPYKLIYLEENDSLLAKNSIENDLSALEPVATILPVLIYIIGLIISILFIRQFIDTRQKDIGILKSNGVSNKYIISIFTLYALSISIGGSILGILLSIIQSRIYTNFYTNAMFLPIFKIIYDYKIILLAIIISVITSILAIIFNIKNIIKVDVLNIINGIQITKYKKINLLRNKLIRVKPFISSIFNKPFRFVFMVVNMIFVVIIVTASVCVKSAKDNSISYIYDKQINYKYVIHYKHDVILMNNKDNSFKELNVKLNDDYYEKMYVLNNTDYVNIYNVNDELLSLGDGIIISSKFAEEENVEIGDYITVNDQMVKVDNISKEITDFKNYMSFDTYYRLFHDQACNAYFIKDNIDDYDINDEGIYYISNNELLKNDIISKFEYISNYIIIIIAISNLISIIVIFNMSIIYFKERIKEHRILRTNGYSKTRIVLCSIIEIIIQAIIALVIGIPIGYLVAKYTISEINNEYFNMFIYFRDIPIIYVCLFIIGVAIIGRLIASSKQLPLVENE